MLFMPTSNHSIRFLRTPDVCFEGLPQYPWAAHYTEALPALLGMRLHYLDEGPRNAAVTWLCLHGNPAWSYLYRHMIPVFLAAGHRVVAPDLPGFGKSDKPTEVAQHSFAWHRSVLLELVESMDLHNINLVVQDWGGLLGLTLPMVAPQRYHGLLVMNTALATGKQPLPQGFVDWRTMCHNKPGFSISGLFARGNPHMTSAECAAYDAPFPTMEYRAATRAFPDMVPERRDDHAATTSREAREFWSTRWQGKSMMAVGERDPVFTPEHMERLRQLIHGCPPMMRVAEGGHFVQEHGHQIAKAAVAILG